VSGLPEADNGRRILAAGAIFALLAVLLGAFAAHGLKSTLDAYRLGIFETAARYQMYHAFALLIAGAIASRPGYSPRWLRAAALAFGFGILLFSGSLYALALTGIGWLGAVTPLGGVAFVLGWLALAIAALKPSPPNRPR
jgi:uncharacterized membrane protein YgdD (TMEM256/DUF423 family)